MNHDTPETILLQFRVSPEMSAQIETLAQATGQNHSQIAQEALRTYVAFEAEQLAKIQDGLNAADAGDFASADAIDEIANRYRGYRSEQAG